MHDFQIIEKQTFQWNDISKSSRYIDTTTVPKKLRLVSVPRILYERGETVHSSGVLLEGTMFF